MKIEERIPLLEEILKRWQDEIGRDYRAYKNHVCRVIHFCFALRPCTEEEREKIVIAGCFHDLGIWTDRTVDYLPPSVRLAKEYLHQRDLDEWAGEIELMIDLHHKLRRYRDENHPLVEVFRRADLIDVSLGLVKWGLPDDDIKQVKGTFPNAGFHKRLNRLLLGRLVRHPLNPVPFLKW